MISVIAPGEEPSGDCPEEIILTPPANPKQIAERLFKKPFQIIADLMELNYFTSIQTELSDEILDKLGQKYNVSFRIHY